MSRPFKVGDIVEGISEMYMYTKTGWRGRVTSVYAGGQFTAAGLNRGSDYGPWSGLSQQYFKLVEEYEQLDICIYCNSNLIKFEDDVLYAECYQCQALYSKDGTSLVGSVGVQELIPEFDDGEYDDIEFAEDDYVAGCSCEYCEAYRRRNPSV